MKQSTGLANVVIFTFFGFLFLPFVLLNAQTHFDKYTGNPILPLGATGEWDDTEAALADVLYDGSMYQMWYSGATQSESYRIGYATSFDGINWNKYAMNPVLGVGASGGFDDSQVWTPAVVRSSSILGVSYKMWYSGNIGTGGIGYAHAYEDPTVWTREGENAVLAGGGFGAWDLTVFNPVVLKSDTLYQMWFSGVSASGLWQTGYATSADGINWSKHPDNPVLTVGAAGEWDAVGALANSVLFIDGEYQMWYNGTTGDPLTQIKIGYATSSDGIDWEKDPGNPILQPGPGDWDAVNASFPKVLKEGSLYRMWYTGRESSSSSIDRLGFAEDSTAVGINTAGFNRPIQFNLKQNYPNPFNPLTTIEFTLLNSASVTIGVFDISGREVATLVNNQPLAPGNHRKVFDAAHLAGGIYLYRMRASNPSTGAGPTSEQTRKLILLK